MTRKQLYIEEGQDRALKARAQELGVSEAELVRRALDDALRPKAQVRGGQEAKVLGELFAEAELIAKTHSFGAYRFDRQTLHDEDERQRRWS
jgi:hypothetical protein